MAIHTRPRFSVALAMLAFALIASDSLASREDFSLRETFYFSPSWGYSVRWYGDEWFVTDEASQDGVDRLAIENGGGATIRFEGRSAYLGDARACLDDQIAALEAEGASDIAVLYDDMQRPQKIYHPWRSWILLIAAAPADEGTLDQAIYLDCRTLMPDDAVFIRELRMPAADFSSDLPELDVLNAALPRGAWVESVGFQLEAPGRDFGWTDSPLPTDSLTPWDFPEAPRPMSGPDGEMGILSVVDGNTKTQDYVVVIENTGAFPLVVDPAQFMISNRPTEVQVNADLSALSAVWTDGAAAGVRTIQPGAEASLLLHFPPPDYAGDQTLLVFWDASITDGGVALTCVTECGYGGGGSRPKVRAVR